MKQKKKKQVVNNKFNFDDEYIIGFSDSKNLENKKKNKNLSAKQKKVKKSGAKNKKQKKARPKMNENKRKLQARLVKIFLIFVLLGGTVCFLFLSPVFNIQEVIVEQNSKIASDTVVSLSSIQLYKNIFSFKKSDAVSNIERNSYVNSVKISRKLPNKIKITVEERIEKYLIEFAEGKYAIIDGQGYVLDITSERKELPVLIGAETSVETLININDNSVRLIENDLKKLDIVANIIETSKNYEVDKYITRIDISDNTDYKLQLADEQKTVYLGSCTDLNTRILFMKEIINKETGKKGEIFINSNLSEHPAYFREAVN